MSAMPRRVTGEDVGTWRCLSSAASPLDALRWPAMRHGVCCMYAASVKLFPSLPPLSPVPEARGETVAHTLTFAL